MKKGVFSGISKYRERGNKLMNNPHIGYKILLATTKAEKGSTVTLKVKNTKVEIKELG